MNSDKNNVSGPKQSTDTLDDLRLEAARKRLIESRNEDDAIEGLREIVANLLGCEEIGLFQVNRSGTFRPCWSFGVDLENYDLLQALGNAGLRRVLGGECHIELPAGDRLGTVAKAQAFVPIRVANQTVGILAVLRLLPQKLAFDRSDMELFKLLSEVAAKPLFGQVGHSAPAAEGSGITA